MFNQTRKQLTFIYGGIIGLILVIMAVSFYFILSGVLQRNIHTRMESTARKVMDEWAHHTHDETGNVHEPGRPGKMEWGFLQRGQFTTISDATNQVISKSSVDNNPLLQQAVIQQLEQQKGISSFSMELIINGAKGVYAISRFPMNDSSKNILTISEEVSDQQQLLDQMKWLLAGLSLALLVIASGTGYFFSRRAMIPISRAYQQQQEFTADASHELRTPLSVLQLSMEILEEQKERLSLVHQTVLNHMKDEIQRMIRLTERLLGLARSESDLLTSRQERFDLKQPILMGVQSMQIVADQKGITLEIVHPHTEVSLPMMGDVDQIQQLLYILLDNAIKYSFRGGSILIQCHRHGDKSVEILLSDEGCGIPPEDIPYLFQRFYRVDKARTRESGGTGLGLSIAARIVQNHGGKISVSSILNEGSTFRIVLPLFVK